MAVPQSFPAKIYQILENESNDIVRWNADGCSFRIVDHGRFEREILPKYFRHNQLSSVQRQLNLYGFKCISRGELRRSFFHPKFKRGEWDVVKKLSRYIPPKKANPYGETTGMPILYDFPGGRQQLMRPIVEDSLSASHDQTATKALQQAVTVSDHADSCTLHAPRWSGFGSSGFSPPGLKLEMGGLQQPLGIYNPSAGNIQRDSKPSALAMRLGFKPDGSTPLPTSRFNIKTEVAVDAEELSIVPSGGQSQQGEQLSLQQRQQHEDEYECELIMDFDLFDDLTQNFDRFEKASSSAPNAAPAQLASGGFSAGSCSCSGNIDAVPLSSSSVPQSKTDSGDANSHVTPVVILPFKSAKAATQDACCMTDLIYSEALGGFIYSS